MQDWLASLWYETVAWISAAGSVLGFSLRVEGGTNIPRHGPALLLANHQCYLDPVFIGLSTRRQLCYLARKTLWQNRVLGWFISSMNAVPVDQEGVAKEGLKTVIELLGRGQAVLIFPEGQRTWDGTMGPLKPGVHLLIKKSRPLIVPVGIAGAYDAWPRWRSYPIPAPLFLPATKGTIAVSIGKPFDSTHLAEMPREQALAELSTAIHKMWRRAEHLRRKV